jgi:hypothetical protein
MKNPPPLFLCEKRGGNFSKMESFKNRGGEGLGGSIRVDVPQLGEKNQKVLKTRNIE